MEPPRVAPVLEEVLSMLEQHPEVYRENVAAVRTQLVEPVLRALGWRTDHIDDVHVNPPAAPGRSGVLPPDYLLCGPSDWRIRVDVRSPGAPLVERGRVRLGRVPPSHEGFGVLTSGETWVLHHTRRAGAAEAAPPRQILWVADLLRDGPTLCARRLGDLAKDRADHLVLVLRRSEALYRAWAELRSSGQDSADLALAWVPALRRRLSAQVGGTFAFTDEDLRAFLEENLGPLLAPPRA